MPKYNRNNLRRSSRKTSRKEKTDKSGDNDREAPIELNFVFNDELNELQAGLDRMDESMPHYYDLSDDSDGDNLYGEEESDREIEPRPGTSKELPKEMKPFHNHLLCKKIINKDTGEEVNAYVPYYNMSERRAFCYLLLDDNEGYSDRQDISSFVLHNYKSFRDFDEVLYLKLRTNFMLNRHETYRLPGGHNKSGSEIESCKCHSIFTVFSDSSKKKIARKLTLLELRRARFNFHLWEIERMSK